MNQTTTNQPSARGGASALRTTRRRTASPPIDVFENADELLLVADVPGVPAEGIDLRIEDGTLTLTARRPDAGEAPPATSREYEEADFVATFRIPAGIDAAAVTAETRQGTLTVRLPRAASAKPRTIVVRPAGGD